MMNFIEGISQAITSIHASVSLHLAIQAADLQMVPLSGGGLYRHTCAACLGLPADYDTLP